MLIVVMSVSAFADVTITKEWEDGMTGTAASNRATPTVNLEGTTPYEQLLNLMYPVGSYYITEEASFNPNVAWGGTWQKIADGRVLIAANGTYPLGSTGGEATHKLTVAEMPSHTHQIGYRPQGNHNGSMWVTDPGTNTGWDDSHGCIKPAGGDQPHNNMQPYKAVNMWKRTA